MGFKSPHTLFVRRVGWSGRSLGESRRLQVEPLTDEGDPVPDMDRRFTFALTHERDLVLEIARSMIGRIQA